MRLVDHALHHPDLFFVFSSPSRSLSLSLFLFPFLFPSPIHTAIVAVITIFLRPLSLSSNDLSIEPRAGNHRTSTNGTANGCVLLVPLHLPHYTQFSAGDLIGFSLLILLPRSLLPRSSPRPFFSLFCGHLRYRLKDHFLLEILTNAFWNFVI